MRLSPRAALLLVTTLLTALVGCGADDDGGARTPDPSSAASSTSTSTSASTPTPEPEPVDATTATGSADLASLCQAVSPDEVAELAGLGDITVEPLQAGTGCSYYDTTDLLAGIVTLTVAGPDDYDGTLREVLEATAAGVAGEVEPLDLGDEAYVVAGAFGEGEKGDGVVRAGGTAVLVGFLPGDRTVGVDGVRDVVVVLLERVVAEL